MIKYWLRKD